jgi:hypothetical protein
VRLALAVVAGLIIWPTVPLLFRFRKVAAACWYAVPVLSLMLFKALAAAL